MRKIFIIAVCFCFACHKNNNSNITPVIITKTITGTVNLYDEFGHRQNSSANATIYLTGINGTTIVNSNYLNPSNDTTTTDSTGKYVFYDVNEGNYNLTFIKSGYDTVRVTNYTIKGSSSSSSLPAQALQANSTTLVTTINVTSKGDTTSDTITISGVINPASAPGKTRDVIVFVGTDTNVSSTHYTYAKTYISASADTFSVKLYSYNLPFTNGSKLYFVAYGQPFGPSSSYLNTATGLLVYPGINSTPSNIQSITLP